MDICGSGFLEYHKWRKEDEVNDIKKNDEYNEDPIHERRAPCICELAIREMSLHMVLSCLGKKKLGARYRSRERGKGSVRPKKIKETVF